MGIYIKIDRLAQQDEAGRYRVSTEAFGGANFYIEINRTTRVITFFLDSSFVNPIRMIDLNNENEVIGTLPNIDSRIISRVIMRSMVAIDERTFPEYLDYAA